MWEKLLFRAPHSSTSMFQKKSASCMMSGTWILAAVIHGNQPGIFKGRPEGWANQPKVSPIGAVNRCSGGNHNKLYSQSFINYRKQPPRFPRQGEAGEEIIPTTILTCKKQQYQRERVHVLWTLQQAQGWSNLCLTHLITSLEISSLNHNAWNASAKHTTLSTRV